MTMVNVIDGGVTAPMGYKAAGARAGIREGKTNKDMAMIYSLVEADAAGVFTRNIVKAAPVIWDKLVVDEQGKAQAVVVNSGIANACTGDEGYNDTVETAKVASEVLNVDYKKVLVASTGVIGFTLPMEIVKSGVKMLSGILSDSREAAVDAATAIMTTDTHKKEIAITYEVGGKKVTMGAMCKGSGMIHPNMGTMLGFITTDVAIDHKLLDKALKEIVEDTFNMVSVDGDTSTNDTVVVLANGMAGNEKITSEGSDYEAFKEALLYVMTHLAKEIAKDGEGATRLFEVQVFGAKDKETAKVLAKSIVTSSLTKCAIYGKDANWGRILCAMGYSGAIFDPMKIDISVASSEGETFLVKGGKAADFDEEEATKILSPEHVIAKAYVHQGDGEATAWGCDLTYDYVKINADYRS